MEVLIFWFLIRVAPIFSSREVLMWRSQSLELKVYLYLGIVRCSLLLLYFEQIIQYIYSCNNKLKFLIKHQFSNQAATAQHCFGKRLMNTLAVVFQQMDVWFKICSDIMLQIPSIQTLMEPLIQIQSSYPIYTVILLPITAIYCGMFISVSNNYILRPKIQAFLYKASISSDLIREVVIDFLSSLSVITYAISAFLLTQPNDIPFQVLAFNDLTWMVICMPILMYWGIKEQKFCGIMLGKNILFLCLCYVCIIYHFISETKLISLPLVLTGLYLINLVINAYELKFKTFIVELFGLSIEPQVKILPKNSSKMPSIQYMAENYPVSSEELQKKIKVYSEYYEKKKKITSKYHEQLQTKILVRIKLLQIALSVAISREKMMEYNKKYVCDYYGQLNGTINLVAPQKNRKKSLLSAQRGTHPEFYRSNSIQSNLHKKQHDEQNVQLVGHKNTMQPLNSQQLSQQPVAQSEQQSPIFYIFPVRLFQSSKIISNIFSIFINLAYGLFLNYAINISNSIEFVSYLNFLYAAMFLPYLPRISAIQYLNTMLLSSIWKYGVIGVFFAIAIGVYNQNGDGITYNWNYTKNVGYQYCINLAALLIIPIIVIGKKLSYRILAAMGVFFFALDAGMEYLKYRPLTENI